MIEGESKKSALYTLTNPTGLAKKQKSYLQRWLPAAGSLNKFSCVDESLSALAVRDDGRFVAVGTMFSGSVSIYVAFSLQVVFKVDLCVEKELILVFAESASYSWSAFDVCYWFGVPAGSYR